MKKRVKTPKIVEVSWSDACSNHGWYDKREAMTDTGTVRMKTIGYLVRRSKRDVAVAQAVSEHGKFSEIWTIPAPWVVRVKTARDKRNRTPKR